MSAAILLTAAGEQTKMCSGMPDSGSAEGELAGASFATSLSERVEGSRLAEEKNTSIAVPNPLSNPKSAAGMKALEEGENVSARLKSGLAGGMPATRRTSTNGTPMNLAAKSVGAPLAKTTEAQQSPTAYAGPAGEHVGSLGEEAKPAVAAPPITLPTGFDERNGLCQRTTESALPSISSAGGLPVTKKTMEIPEPPKEVVATKVAKIQKNEVTQRALPQGATVAGVNPPGSMPDKTDAMMAVGSVAAQAVASGAAPVAEPNRDASAKIGEVTALAAKGNVGVPQVSGDELVRPAMVIERKANSSDAVAVAELPKTEVEPLKASAVSIPLDSEGNKSVQSVLWQSVSVAHQVTGVGGNASLAMPGIVVSGGPAGDWATTKSPITDAGARTANSLSETKEQAAPGVVGMPLDGTPQMLTGTPTTLEVGIQNGTHGWLRVRAEMTDGGSVNASVSTASAAGQEMLHRELPSLTAYLQEEKVSVNTVVVHALPPVGVEPRSSAGMDSAGGQTAQRGSEGESQQQYVKGTMRDRSGEAMTYRALQEVDEEGSLQLATYATGGGWLSVRA